MSCAGAYTQFLLISPVGKVYHSKSTVTCHFIGHVVEQDRDPVKKISANCAGSGISENQAK